MLSGVVALGDQRGRTIGFPTCNLGGVEEALPPLGVYAVLVDRERPSGRPQALAAGVANIGVRPTVKEGELRPSVEVHLFDFAGTSTGRACASHLMARLRPEQKFAGLDGAQGADRPRRRGGARAAAAPTARRLAVPRPVGGSEGRWCG